MPFSIVCVDKSQRVRSEFTVNALVVAKIEARAQVFHDCWLAEAFLAFWACDWQLFCMAVQVSSVWLEQVEDIRAHCNIKDCSQKIRINLVNKYHANRWLRATQVEIFTEPTLNAFNFWPYFRSFSQSRLYLLRHFKLGTFSAICFRIFANSSRIFLFIVGSHLITLFSVPGWFVSLCLSKM